mmetsp:Transcript_10743/g.15715  ORF Transcript_10743/g.15715 Transcript_10743/m.15715 type:complete len:293 (+) Transcript_10743:1816-2694(+)
MEKVTFFSLAYSSGIRFSETHFKNSSALIPLKSLNSPSSTIIPSLNCNTTILFSGVSSIILSKKSSIVLTCFSTCCFMPFSYLFFSFDLKLRISIGFCFVGLSSSVLLGFDIFDKVFFDFELFSLIFLCCELLNFFSFFFLSDWFIKTFFSTFFSFEGDLSEGGVGFVSTSESAHGLYSFFFIVESSKFIDLVPLTGFLARALICVSFKVGNKLLRTGTIDLLSLFFNSSSFSRIECALSFKNFRITASASSPKVALIDFSKPGSILIGEFCKSLIFFGIILLCSTLKVQSF